MLSLDGGDPYNCQALLKSGRWLDGTDLRNWQPPSCMMHTYKPKEAQLCFSGGQIIFAGDSMVREMFWALARQLDSDNSLPIPAETEKHSDIHLTVKSVRLDFYWDPYLNTSGFEHAFNIPDDVPKPSMTIVGTGLWYAKNVVTSPFESWQTTIDAFVMS